MLFWKVTMSQFWAQDRQMFSGIQYPLDRKIWWCSSPEQGLHKAFTIIHVSSGWVQYLVQCKCPAQSCILCHSREEWIQIQHLHHFPYAFPSWLALYPNYSWRRDACTCTQPLSPDCGIYQPSYKTWDLQWWPASMTYWYDSDTNDVGGTNAGFIFPLGDETQDGQRLGGQEPVLNRIGGPGSSQILLLC